MAYHIDIETLRRLARSVMPDCTVYGLPGGDLHLVMGGNPIAYVHRGALSDDMVVSNNRGFEHALKPETAEMCIRDSGLETATRRRSHSSPYRLNRQPLPPLPYASMSATPRGWRVAGT